MSTNQQRFNVTQEHNSTWLKDGIYRTYSSSDSKVSNKTPHKSGTYNLIRIKNHVDLYFESVYLRNKLRFCIPGTLALNIFSGIKFIIQHILCFNPNELSFLPLVSQPIDILLSSLEAINSTFKTNLADNAHMKYILVGGTVSKQIWVQQHSFILVNVFSMAKGLIRREPNLSLLQCRPLAESVIMKIITCMKFKRLPTEVSNNAITLQIRRQQVNYATA